MLSHLPVFDPSSSPVASCCSVLWSVERWQEQDPPNCISTSTAEANDPLQHQEGSARDYTHTHTHTLKVTAHQGGGCLNLSCGSEWDTKVKVLFGGWPCRANTCSGKPFSFFNAPFAYSFAHFHLFPALHTCLFPVCEQVFLIVSKNSGSSSYTHSPLTACLLSFSVIKNHRQVS